MNFFTISSILVTLSSISIAILSSLKAKEKRTSLFWAAFCLLVAIWGIAGYKISLITNYESAVLWWKIGLISVLITPVMYTHFVFLYTLKTIPKFLLLLYGIALAYIGGIFINFDFFLGKLVFVFSQFYWIAPFHQNRIFFIIYYVAFYWLLLGYAFYCLVKAFRSSSGISRMQLKYFILTSVFGWFGAEGGFFPGFNQNIYPYANFSMAVYPIIMAYAIFKYRLLDIRVAITRTGLFIAVYTPILGLPFALGAIYKDFLIELLGASWWVAPLVLMAFMATSGPYIYIYIQRRAEDRLLKEQRRYQDTLKHAAIGMTRIRNLRRLLNLVTHIVTKTVKITYAAIYLFDDPQEEYTLRVVRDSRRVPISKVKADIPLIKWLRSKQIPVIYEEVKRQMQDTSDATFRALEQDMRELLASVIIPSFLEDRMLGFIVLGDKVSGQIYTPEDLSVFQVLASQAALAIENAQFYEEAKEMQAQIAQAEKMATIGTMADGLSHQINNRFYALSLIAGDTIDTIKLTDTKNCSPEIQEMIKQIGSALDRIQANVMQGGEVVKGILKYTRKGNEGMEFLTLDQVIDATLDMVKYKVKLHEIDIIREYPKDLAKIYVNFVQIQEVFFNLIDNGYDAMVERRNTFNEKDYRGKITISAVPQETTMRIVVQDNGIGVKKEDIRKIFTPFFTTKASSRKGTGLGLYVIRNIVTETHKGTIAFESEYRVGTKFIIELPLQPLPQAQP